MNHYDLIVHIMHDERRCFAQSQQESNNLMRLAVTCKPVSISTKKLITQCLSCFRDGGYETSPLIGKFCGTTRPPVLVSHSNRLWVRFRSDYIVTQIGFEAHWDGTQTGK